MSMEFLNKLASLGDDWVSNLAKSPCVLACSPATFAPAAGTEGWTQVVEVTLSDPDGNVCDWFNGTFPAAIAEDTAGDGTASIGESVTTITLARGKGSLTITGSDTWAAADTATLTINASNTQEIFGRPVVAKTSVGTVPGE